MIHQIRKSSRLIVTAIFILTMAGVGCKSKKKAMEATARDNASIEKVKQEQEALLRKQKEEEERKKAIAEEDRVRRETEAKAREPKARLEQYFSAIASSANTSSANNSINEALSLFASGDTPVLIVIHESGGQKDYDRPTTIRDYLNYLKDQKKNFNRIGNLQFDSAGKITEVELIKQK
ncbi:MAG TPA: nucleoid-structuring protein H-NS [Ohtaekwangia sp.]|uniref:nucleoid-structuring protein H-NS n=1 Tax=Ohtaekwangia sp. TaxID=2066019 RepID=UPI002F94C72E